jgi:acetamidase/formamidase
MSKRGRRSSRGTLQAEWRVLFSVTLLCASQSVRAFDFTMRKYNLLSAAVLAVAFSALSVRAGEIAYDHFVPLTPENAIIGHFSPTKKPVLTIQSGAVVKIDGGGGARWGEEDPDKWLKDNKVPGKVADYPALVETMKVLKETPRAEGIANGHLLVGPIFIEGAEPGDSIEVRVLDVTPRIPYGTVGGRPGTGALADMVPRPFNFVVPLDMKRNAGVFDDKVEVPLAPFMGVMGTCPADSEGPTRRSGPPGVFGGNLDCKELVTGSTLFLPVFQKGALFYTGDSHAAQGDGEITVNAIETANTCTFQFILHKGKKLTAPRAENADYYLTFGLDPDLDKAMRMAILETIDFLKEKEGYDFFRAYALTSIGIDFRVTQVVDGTQGIHGMIAKKLFIKDANPYWYRAR